MDEQKRQLGPYIIEREVGRGGMGVVYLARDSRLDRDVAIKVLPDELAQDPERLARFEREARLLASLNHPNVAGIYGIEEADDQRFLSLEYIDGPTLAERLERGPLPVEEALSVCRQIAVALETAHEIGIIHRDLKPANVKLTPEGKVKVLDFGLAKAGAASGDSAAELSQSPTITAHFTAPGMILGTAAYMSPEQARGKPMDRRTDIFSFGCVLYECLTGRQLFSGETVSDIIAQILEREPDWSLLPPSTPRKVREVLRRCLEKDPKKRQRDIGDARLAFDEVKEEQSSAIMAARGEKIRGPGRRALVTAWTVAGLALAVAAISLGTSGILRKVTPESPVRFEIVPPPGVTMTAWPNLIALSPDGNSLFWSGVDSTGTRLLWIRSLRTLESRSVPQSTGMALPFWSWDGRSVAYVDGSKLRKISIDGGDPQTVCDATSTRGGTWGSEYIVLAGEQGPLYRVPASGGTPEPVTKLDLDRGEIAHRFPKFLPDGKTFLYVALPAKLGRLTVFASDVDGREPVEIMSSVSSPVYAEPGYLLFQHDRRLLAQRFDPDKLELSGEPVMIGPAPRRPPPSGAPAVSASRNGRIAYLNVQDLNTRLVWWNRDQNSEEPLGMEPGRYLYPAVSPDGRFVAFSKEISPEESDIWILELARMVVTRFTFGPGQHSDPIWSPDGKHIAYSTDKDGPWNIYRRAFPGGGDPEPVAINEMLFKNPLDWSPDGKYLLYEQIGTGTNMDLWIAPVDGSGEPQPYLENVYQEEQGRFSPDGKWVVYVSAETGESEMYVTSFPDPEKKFRLSAERGFYPEWDSDGDEIIYLSLGSRGAMSVPVQMEPEFRTETPRLLCAWDEPGTRIALDPGGRRVLQVQPEAARTSIAAVVVLNWASELEDAR